MSDPHTNIFHAYRGPASSEEVSARQLEDNLTRALVITLNHVRESGARMALLDALHVPTLHQDKAYHCHLQVSAASPDWPNPSKRRLLVIHGGPVLATTGSSSDADTGRADAVIATEDFLLAIESKLGDQVQQSQLDRHRETLGILETGISNVTWSDLVRVVRRILAKRPAEPIARFVLEQFEEYLRMNGFGGLTQDHFTFFAQAPSDRDPLVKEGIRRALREIGDEVARSSGTSWTPHVMNIRMDQPEAGAVLETGTRAEKPHLTISIDAAGLSIFANVELQGPYTQFVKAWQVNPSTLIETIRQLGNVPVQSADDIPWHFRVVRRVSLGRPREYHYWSSVDIAANTLADWPDEMIHQFVDRVTEKPEGEGAPEIMFVRSYPVPVVLGSDQLSERLSADAAQLESFFNWIGVPFRESIA